MRRLAAGEAGIGTKKGHKNMTQQADSILLSGAAGPSRPRRFAVHHRYDHNFFAAYVLLIWLGIGMGFGPQIARHFARSQPAYPLIVHIHAAVFVGWLVLLTTQVLLIRACRVDLHRALGVAGGVMAGVMIVLGPTTALMVQHLQLGRHTAIPRF
jgi:hypothetical protein